MSLSDDELGRRARGLRWLLLDVDGVLTDGRLVYGSDGEALKTFHVRDGFALKLARRLGLRVGLLSGRGSPALTARARDLELDEVVMGRSDKGRAFDELLERQGVDAAQVAFIGDDLPDLPVLSRCGLSFAPADAVAEVRERVDRVLTSRGGEGTAREMVEILLTARGEWLSTVSRFLPPGDAT